MDLVEILSLISQACLNSFDYTNYMSSRIPTIIKDTNNMYLNILWMLQSVGPPMYGPRVGGLLAKFKGDIVQSDTVSKDSSQQAF